MLREQVVDDPDPLAGMQLSMGDQPDRDRDRSEIRQDHVDSRCLLAHLEGHRRDAEALLHQRPQHETVLGVVLKVLPGQVQAEGIQRHDHAVSILDSDKGVIGKVLGRLWASAPVEILGRGI